MEYETVLKALEAYINEEFDPRKHDFPATRFNTLRKLVKEAIHEAYQQGYTDGVYSQKPPQ